MGAEKRRAMRWGGKKEKVMSLGKKERRDKNGERNKRGVRRKKECERSSKTGEEAKMGGMR